MGMYERDWWQNRGNTKINTVNRPTNPSVKARLSKLDYFKENNKIETKRKVTFIQMLLKLTPIAIIVITALILTKR